MAWLSSPLPFFCFPLSSQPSSINPLTLGIGKKSVPRISGVLRWKMTASCVFKFPFLSFFFPFLFGDCFSVGCELSEVSSFFICRSF